MVSLDNSRIPLIALCQLSLQLVKLVIRRIGGRQNFDIQGLHEVGAGQNRPKEVITDSGAIDSAEPESRRWAAADQKVLAGSILRG